MRVEISKSEPKGGRGKPISSLVVYPLTFLGIASDGITKFSSTPKGFYPYSVNREQYEYRNSQGREGYLKKRHPDEIIDLLSFIVKIMKTLFYRGRN